MPRGLMSTIGDISAAVNELAEPSESSVWNLGVVQSYFTHIGFFSWHGSDIKGSLERTFFALSIEFIYG